MKEGGWEGWREGNEEEKQAQTRKQTKVLAILSTNKDMKISMSCITFGNTKYYRYFFKNN